MELNYDTLSKFKELSDKLKNVTLSSMPDYSSINFTPEIPTIEIDEESTFAYQMQQQTNQIIEKSNEQIKLLTEQNKQLENNYMKLEELYNLKDSELKDAMKDAKRARRYNIVMMIITIASMAVAIAAWLLPNILGGGI